MEDNQFTISLSDNILGGNPSGLTPMSNTIISQEVTQPAGIEINNTSVNAIQVNQEQENLFAQAQVVTPSQTVTNNVVTIQQSIEVSEASKSEDNIKDKQEGIQVVPETKFTMSDTFTVNTEVFKTMISNAKKAAICDSYLVYSTILDITFDNEYLKVVSTDGDNVLVQTNKNLGFKDTLHFNVMAELFVNLISKLDCEKITFELNSENRYIRLITSDGSEFNIPEFYDRDSGQNVNLERAEGKIQADDIVIDIDGIQFKQLIQSAGTLTADPKLFDYLSGVYCSDKIYSTDAENMFGLPNIPELTNYSFYLSGKFVKLLLALNFNSKSKIVLRPSPSDSIVISHIILMDDNMILEGACDLENTAKYPISTIQDYISQSFESKFTIEKSKLESVLKIAELFIEVNTDKECCVFAPNTSKATLEVKSRNKQAHQYISIQGLNVELKEFYLRVRDLIKVLDNCVSDIITIEVDNKEYRNIKIMDKDFVLITAIQNL